MFLKPEKLQNHSNEGKGKEKKKERGEGKEEKKKKSIVALLVFTIATLEILAEKNCWTQKVHCTINWTGSVSASHEKVNLQRGLFKAVNKVQIEKKI